MMVTDAERAILLSSITVPQTRIRVVNYIRLGYSPRRIAELLAVRETDVAALKNVGR